VSIGKRVPKVVSDPAFVTCEEIINGSSEDGKRFKDSLLQIVRDREEGKYQSGRINIDLP